MLGNLVLILILLCYFYVAKQVSVNMIFHNMAPKRRLILFLNIITHVVFGL